ncbi:toxin-antitoxin system YwqK family antitoxin [Gelidibacter salicanalis]|uniref:Nicotinic acid mononucleotide adenyltransferase n=1 Tax=Gelidibacter salicanalis TaxID=291193 RepID=A0A934KRT4_9FLAO|nr:nicotinic acid mononucleotide adenyltransferase [Gelidibacter salicanalis]MBJ7880895.1 nicotinic acid mononucleotide adenyltransferase [Gelidibacter salicanalis]
MRKQILFLFALLITVTSFSQQKRDLKLNEKAKVIEVTYYHDNGVVSQTGAYTLDGKLQGEWLSYDTEGNKIVAANYDNGKKVGKWFYWNDETLKEVDYKQNAIAKVVQWNEKSSVAVRN